MTPRRNTLRRLCSSCRNLVTAHTPAKTVKANRSLEFMWVGAFWCGILNKISHQTTPVMLEPRGDQNYGTWKQVGTSMGCLATLSATYQDSAAAGF